MPANENPDRLQLKQLLDEAKPLMLPMFPDQQKKWLSESPLAQEIKSLLAKTLNITTTSALSSATFSRNQNPKPNGPPAFHGTQVPFPPFDSTIGGLPTITSVAPHRTQPPHTRNGHHPNRSTLELCSP